MMSFFEFFFSGPGWGWRLFGLICLLSVVIELIPRTISLIMEYKGYTRPKTNTTKLKDIIKKDILGNNPDDSNEGTPATKDDVR